MYNTFEHLFYIFFFCKVYDWLNVLFLIANGSSRKAWLLTTTLVILFPFSISTYEKREEGKENELAKVVIKSHAFLLDLANDLNWFKILFDTNKLGNEVKTKLRYTRAGITKMFKPRFSIKPSFWGRFEKTKLGFKTYYV